MRKRPPPPLGDGAGAGAVRVPALLIPHRTEPPKCSRCHPSIRCSRTRSAWSGRPRPATRWPPDPDTRTSHRCWECASAPVLSLPLNSMWNVPPEPADATRAHGRVGSRRRDVDGVAQPLACDRPSDRVATARCRFDVDVGRHDRLRRCCRGSCPSSQRPDRRCRSLRPGPSRESPAATPLNGVLLPPPPEGGGDEDEPAANVT